MSKAVELSEVKADLKDVEAAGQATKSLSPDDTCTIVEHKMTPSEIATKLQTDFTKGLTSAGSY